MVWGCFWGKQRGPLVPLMHGSVNVLLTSVSTESYCAAGLFLSLRTYALPSVVLSFNRTMQKSTLRRLCLRFLSAIIPRESHPAYSPDLNPIEHAWTLLKRQLLADYPDICDYPGDPEKVKKKLAEVLPRCWEKIPPKQFEALWRSMPDRVQAIIEAKGWYTRY